MSSDPSCIFCKIVAGEIPAHKVHEDDEVLAFLDIGPLSRGHSLVIPKAHHVTLDTMDDETAAACVRAVVRLSGAVRDAVDAEGWNVLQNNGRVSGQAVGHVHFHIIPRNEGDGLGYRWHPKPLDESDAPALAQEIRSLASASSKRDSKQD